MVGILVRRYAVAKKAGEHKDDFSLPISGCDVSLYTKNGYLVSNGYTRIITSTHGTCIEIDQSQIEMNHIYIPYYEMWRKRSSNSSYIEYRTYKDNISLHQKKKAFASVSRKPNFFYVKCSDLYTADGKSITGKELTQEFYNGY